MDLCLNPQSSVVHSKGDHREITLAVWGWEISLSLQAQCYKGPVGKDRGRRESE